MNILALITGTNVGYITSNSMVFAGLPALTTDHIGLYTWQLKLLVVAENGGGDDNNVTPQSFGRLSDSNKNSNTEPEYL